MPHPNYIAAVELHRHLLNDHNTLIWAKNVLENKVQSKHGQWTPSKYRLWQHAILNWQYNDNGISRNDLSFRTLIDVLHLESKDFLLNPNTTPKSIKYFYNLLSLFDGNYKNYSPQKKIIYKWKLQSKTFQKSHSFFINFTGFASLFISRVILFLSSKTYRRRVLNHPKLLGQGF